MFETAVVRGRVADRRFGFLSLSLAAHTAAVAAVIAASVASTRLPVEAPKQMMRVYFSTPPALGTPDGGHPRPPAAMQPAAPVLHTAPTTIPSTIVAPAPESGPSTEVSSGPIGVPWGVKDSVIPDGPPAPPDAAGPLRISDGVKSPIVLHRVEPLYPPLALQRRINGTVILQCIIDKSGHIRDVTVVHSTFGAFEQPAIDAVQQWLFAPGTLNGQAVDTIFELTVRFQVR